MSAHTTVMSTQSAQCCSLIGRAILVKSDWSQSNRHCTCIASRGSRAHSEFNRRYSEVNGEFYVFACDKFQEARNKKASSHRFVAAAFRRKIRNYETK